jgi:hypothetical protein
MVKRCKVPASTCVAAESEQGCDVNRIVAESEQGCVSPPEHTPQEIEAGASHVHQLELQLKQCNAELKIHRDAYISEADKFAVLSKKFDDMKHEHDAVAARLCHVLKMVRAAQAAQMDLVTTQDSFDADGWRIVYQRLVSAIRPMFEHRD